MRNRISETFLLAAAAEMRKGRRKEIRERMMIQWFKNKFSFFVPAATKFFFGRENETFGNFGRGNDDPDDPLQCPLESNFKKSQKLDIQKNKKEKFSPNKTFI
jgi:hypothetical protein